VGFDRKEDFRSSFKEDKKPNEGPKKCQKQGKAAHGRVAMAGATNGRASTVHGARHGVRPSTAVPAPCRA